MSSDARIADNPAAGRYEATVEGRLAGFLAYERSGDTVVLPHTVVSSEFEGRGVAGELTRFALDDIATDDRARVVPACSYVRAWIDRNPEYARLVQRQGA